MSSKRLILFYISEVSGHRNAAIAIEKALRALKPDIEILSINAFKYTNPVSEKIVNRLYMSVINKAPKIWDYLYDNQEIAKKIEKIKKIVHKFNSPKFKNLFNKFKPDAIICTQAFPCGMVADYKKTYNSKIPLLAVLTDYIPHSYWIYDAVDYYITPSKNVSLRLVNKGVHPDKIRDFGIPFNYEFNEPVDRERVFKKYNLKKEIPIILIMGGGHGLGPIKTIVKSLEHLKREIQEIIITGTNKKLYKSLKKAVPKYKQNINVFGYVDNVHEFMSISDMIITKPGGITTAEVLSKRIPMIIIKPIPGQEASNSAYLTGEGAAIQLDNPKAIDLLVDDLLNNPSKTETIRFAAGNMSKPNSSMDIARFILGLPNV